MSKQQNRDRALAAFLTLIIAVGLLVALFFLGIDADRAMMANNSQPEITLPVEEPEEEPEEFIEPQDIVPDAGDPDDQDLGEPAPTLKGEPEPAPVKNDKVVVKDENPNPAPPIPKPITQKQSSPVKATTPSKTDKPESKATASVKNAFSGRNGATTGSVAGTGSGGTSDSSRQGSLKGRRMLSCPEPSVALKTKVVIVVNVVVDENGNVKSASATGGGEAYLRNACVAAAKNSKWTPSKGVGDAHGTITFTIIPR